MALPIIAIIGGIQAANALIGQLVAAASRADQGTDPTPEDTAAVKAAQKLAEDRFDAAAGHPPTETPGGG